MLRRLPSCVGTLVRRPICRTLCADSHDGWIFGHLLDGEGGSAPLEPWDAAAVRQARDSGHGAWVHLDFRAPQAKDFIAACARARTGKDHQIKRETHVSSLMVADPRKTQPRCEVASTWIGMLLQLEVNFGRRFDANSSFLHDKNIVPFRMWLGRGILVTARGRQPEEGAMRMPSLSQTLEEGRGPSSCGALASAVISELTSITADSAQALEDEIFALKARLQQQALLAGAHRPVGSAALQGIRRELMPLRYAAISMRRYEVPELNALETVVRLTNRPEQTLFAEADKYEIREAHARQEALVESLNATIEAGETLQNEVAAHAAWQNNDYSFQLTVLGCVLSVLGFCSISIDAIELATRIRAGVSDQGTNRKCNEPGGETA